MKIYLFLFAFLFPICLLAQTISFNTNSSGDVTRELQDLANNNQYQTIIINKRSIIINGILNIPKGKVLRIENDCLLSGSGTINGGIIEGNYQSHLFDSTLKINPESLNQYFSAKWYGATGNGNKDDYKAIQTSINTCIRNNIRTLYIPAGRYKISQPLILSANTASNRFCTLEILGESSFWDSNMGSELLPTFKNSFSIGIQLGKGCKVRKLAIRGLFTPPNPAKRKEFFNINFEKFTDASCRDNRYSPYSAIVIDPFSHGNENTLPQGSRYPGLEKFYGNKTNGGEIRGGSTATEIEEMKISNFVVGICSSPNGITQNAEITLINKIQFENCKLCISGGQAQEKANTISNIYCWGGTHTMFATGLYGSSREAGNWNIDHVNIAGAVVRFIYNDQHGYFPTYISHVFAESLGCWGTLNSELACSVNDCMVDFAYNNEAGDRNLLNSWGQLITYRNCNFRFYGEKTPLHFETNALFENCYFSGPVIKGGNVSGFGIGKKIVPGSVLTLIMILLVFLSCVNLIRMLWNETM